MWKMWKKRAMHRVTYLLTKHLLKAVHEEELLVFTNKGWYINHKRLDHLSASNLRAGRRSYRPCTGNLICTP